MTKMTANPMPTAVSIFLDTPMKGQMPRNWTRMKLLFIESVVYGLTGGAGFLLAIVLFASIRERLEFSDPPKAFKGWVGLYLEHLGRHRQQQAEGPAQRAQGEHSIENIHLFIAVIFVMGLASALCYPVNLLLQALDLKYMQTVAFILVIASLGSLPRDLQTREAHEAQGHQSCGHQGDGEALKRLGRVGELQPRPSSPPTARCWAWCC